EERGLAEARLAGRAEVVGAEDRADSFEAGHEAASPVSRQRAALVSPSGIPRQPSTTFSSRIRSITAAASAASGKRRSPRTWPSRPNAVRRTDAATLDAPRERASDFS